MRMALDKLGSKAILECANYMDTPWQLDNVTGRVSADDCDVYTVSDDVPDDFTSWNLMVDLAEVQRSRYVQNAGDNPPIWPSFDYIQVGGAQTLEQYRAQVGFLAISPAPLIIGSLLDLGKQDMLPQSVLDIYKAKAVLEIHSDPLGARGTRISHSPEGSNGAFLDVWQRELAGSRQVTIKYAYLLINRGGRPQTFTIALAEFESYCLNDFGKMSVIDAWAGSEEVIHGANLTRTVEGEGSALL